MLFQWHTFSRFNLVCLLVAHASATQMRYLHTHHQQQEERIYHQLCVKDKTVYASLAERKDANQLRVHLTCGQNPYNHDWMEVGKVAQADNDMPVWTYVMYATYWDICFLLAVLCLESSLTLNIYMSLCTLQHLNSLTTLADAAEKVHHNDPQYKPQKMDKVRNMYATQGHSVYVWMYVYMMYVCIYVCMVGKHATAKKIIWG